MNDLERLTHQILDEIADIKTTTEMFNLDEQDGAAEQLPKILEQTRALATTLNDFCNCDHLPASRLAQGEFPPDVREPLHEQ